MKNIYIGVCKTREDDRFNSSYRNFIDSICGEYSVCTKKVLNTYLPDAQNEIAKDFLSSGYSHLLLLDDDQWGHTKEMLETLFNANTYVATIKTYSRHYPYGCSLLRKVPPNLVMPIETAEGYAECDLTGFPMTLISRGTFDLLEEPYFRPHEVCGRTWNSDVDFFQRLEEKGIKPIGCFQHVLNHADITEENVKQKRYEDRFTGNNIAQWKLIQSLENGTFKIEDLNKESLC